MKYKLTRIIKKYGWNAEHAETRAFEIEDTYDPMDWDDLINNVGYLVGGHAGQDIIVKIRAIQEEE